LPKQCQKLQSAVAETNGDHILQSFFLQVSLHLVEMMKITHFSSTIFPELLVFYLFSGTKLYEEQRMAIEQNPNEV